MPLPAPLWSRPSLLAFLAASSLVVALPLSAQTPDVKAKLIAPGLAAGSKGTVTVEMTMGTGWHVNSHTPSESYLIPTSLALTASAGTFSAVRYPKQVEKRFPFADQPLRVYEGTVRFETDLELPKTATGKVFLAGTLSYQACNEKQCFPPAKISLEASPAVSAPGARPAP